MAELRTIRMLVAAGATALALGLGGGASAQEAAPVKNFDTFLQELQADAVARGIRAQTASTALSGI